MFIKKNDTVKILIGRDRDKTGKVIEVSGKARTVTVEGRNMFVRHQRPRKSGEKGQKIHFPRPLKFSKVMLVCPHCEKTTRKAYQFDEVAGKVRFCKQCKKRI